MKFQKAPVALTELIDGNAVVMNSATMQCFLLNDLAAVLWDALDHFPRREDLLALLRDAQVENADAVLDGLTVRLLELGLIQYAT
jgi:hypothetical protein